MPPLTQRRYAATVLGSRCTNCVVRVRALPAAHLNSQHAVPKNMSECSSVECLLHPTTQQQKILSVF